MMLDGSGYSCDRLIAVLFSENKVIFETSINEMYMPLIAILGVQS